MKTSEIIEILQGQDCVVKFSNTKESWELPIKHVTRSELRHKANKSLTIECEDGSRFSRKSIISAWDHQPAKEAHRRKRIARRKDVEKSKVKTAGKPKTAKKSEKTKETKGRDGSQGTFIQALILEGLGNAEIYRRMLEHFGPGVIDERHKTHPAWYRWKMKKEGKL